MSDNDDFLEGLAEGFLLFFDPTTKLGWLCYAVIAIWAIYYFW